MLRCAHCVNQNSDSGLRLSKNVLRTKLHLSMSGTVFYSGSYGCCGQTCPDTLWAETASLPEHKARCQSGRSGTACVGMDYFTGPCN